MTILVIGGTGTVGSQVTARLAGEGLPVRCMSRWQANIESLPDGVDGRIGDLNKPATLRPVFAGVDKVFLVTPLSQNETLQGVAAVDAAKAAGVKKIVYMSVPMPQGSGHIPHFRSKVPIEDAVRASGIAYTLLRPNNLFQNDHWCQAAIMVYNTYPQPIGTVGLNRIDARDVADAAVNALLHDEYDGQDYAIHGAVTYTGADVAAVFGRHLKRDVRYGGDDLDAWAKQSQHMMPAWMVQDLRVMYQFFQQHGLIATDTELARQRALVGHAPRGFDDFVDEILPAWKKHLEEGKHYQS
jgi:uncharacterized protein YbjT (DUF2867 family)